MDSGGGKITLDQESFRALASDVRVDILKRLDSRRETVTDLSNLLQLSKPTLLEHLEKLQTAGLVKRIDEGRKWIYYELTDKGRKILHPEKVAITLALASAIVLAAIGAFALISSSGSVLSGPGYSNQTALQGVRDATPSIGAGLIGPLLFLLAVLGGAILFFRNRTRVRAPAKPFTWWQVLARALGVAFLVAVLIAWPRAIQAARERAGTQANTTADGGTFTTVWPAAAAGPIEIFLLVAVLLAVAWLAYLFRRARMQGDATDWEDGFPVSMARGVAAETVREAIQEIESGGEVRPVILACFQRFCALLGSRGSTQQDPLTPRELERLAVDRLRVSRDDSATLTSLFEEARYSEHPLGDIDRARAIDSLGKIRVALEG